MLYQLLGACRGRLTFVWNHTSVCETCAVQLFVCASRSIMSASLVYDNSTTTMLTTPTGAADVEHGIGFIALFVFIISLFVCGYVQQDVVIRAPTDWRRLCTYGGKLCFVIGLFVSLLLSLYVALTYNVSEGDVLMFILPPTVCLVGRGEQTSGSRCGW